MTGGEAFVIALFLCAFVLLGWYAGGGGRHGGEA